MTEAIASRRSTTCLPYERQDELPTVRRARPEIRKSRGTVSLPRVGAEGIRSENDGAGTSHLGIVHTTMACAIEIIIGSFATVNRLLAGPLVVARA